MTTTKEWIRKLKIALINESIEDIAELYGSVPDSYDSLDDAKESAALMSQIISLLRKRREELQEDMDQTKKAISYQKNVVGSKRSRYDQLG